MRDIRPIFDTVETVAAAEALSEPFTQRNAFHVHLPKEVPTSEVITEGNLIAIGSAYVDDSDEVGFEYAMHPLVAAPLSGAQEFADRYDKRLTSDHNQADLTVRTLGADGLDNWKTWTIEYAKEAGLRTIGTYALFGAQRPAEYAGVLLVPSTIVAELPLKGREEALESQKHPVFDALNRLMLGLAADVSADEVDKGMESIVRNEGQEKFGMFTATLHMPRIQALRKIIDAHPEINGFLSLPRKQKRELLRAETKAQRKRI